MRALITAIIVFCLSASTQVSAGPAPTKSNTITPTVTPTPSITPTFSISPTFSVSPTFSPSPTITLTPTMGEGSYGFNPNTLVIGQPSEFDLTFTAGATAYPASGGLITLFFPLEFGDPAQHFSVHPLDRPKVKAISVQEQMVRVEVFGLAPFASMVFRYGHDADGFILKLGVPGSPTPTSTVTPTASPSITATSTDVPPGSSDTVTPSISPTFSESPSFTASATFSHSPTPSPTFTAGLGILVWAYPQSVSSGSGGLLPPAPTFIAVSPTFTITPSITVTSTITQTWTSSPTSTPTPTITQTFTETPIAPLQDGKVFAYPNPYDMRRFNKVTFRFPEDHGVLITVFNLLGHPVREIPVSDINESQGWAVWSGTDDYNRQVNGGVYYVRVRGQARVLVKRFTVLR